MNERKPLSAQYIGTMHKAAMRALADIAVRRRWGNSRNASPVATLSLCEEIARLQIERAEMLAALKRLLATINVRDADSHAPGCRCVIHEARAVIARAEGGDQS